ncbi:hypothetical protein EV356DRAFT_535125 [Viridothelium virens]|uniref:RNA polymerase I associated factor, A49-like protein n=1 Tax=Viridothelium virens TaxID=1048519 RepID=A0A6A6H1W0_VIRVR|nr:hypothetical protein EV356DRAFT_535125 [Viridothelium virens]
MSEAQKRKRESEDDSESDANEHFSRTVRLQLVEDDDDWCPIIASSPGLAFPSDISLQTYKKKTGGSVLSDPRIAPSGYKSDPVSYELLLHSTSHPKLDFIGKEEEANQQPKLDFIDKEEKANQEPDTDYGLKHYTGVFDPETGTLQVIPSRKVTLRHIPRVEAEEMSAQAAAAAQQRSTVNAQRNELGMEFGSRRAKKAISANVQNAIAPSQAQQVAAASSVPEKLDAIGSALLSDAAAANKDRPSKAALQAAVDEAKPRPKANLDAKIAADVYTIENLVGEDVMKALTVRDWLDCAEKGDGIQTNSKHVANRLHQVATGTKKDVQKLRLLKYIETLIIFNNTLKSGKRGTKAVPKFSELKEKLNTSEIVVSRIEQSFSDGGNVGKWHSDYLHTHISALALIVDNFQVMTADLKHDLKLDDKTVVQYFRELGCQVRSASDGERIKAKMSKAASAGLKIAVLKLPLDFPVQRPPGRARR